MLGNSMFQFVKIRYVVASGANIWFFELSKCKFTKVFEVEQCWRVDKFKKPVEHELVDIKPEFHCLCKYSPEHFQYYVLYLPHVFFKHGWQVKCIKRILAKLSFFVGHLSCSSDKPLFHPNK